MCNLNLFIKTEDTKGIKNLNLVSFLNVITSNSFINNSDGEGVYLDNENFLKTSRNKINLLKYLERIGKSKFILLHERLATSGLSVRYTHPFKSKEFVLLHNGILSNFKGRKKSDTFIFFNKFLNLFRKNNLKNREKRITKSIKKLLNESDGSYSIALFDIKTQTLYYFKNDRTSIAFFVNKKKNGLFISTEKDNKKFLEIFGFNKYEEMEIKDYIIYSIKIKNNEILIKNKGKIKETDYEFTYNWDLTKEDKTKEESNKTRTNYNYNQDNDLTNFKYDIGFYEYGNLEECKRCKTLTANKNHFDFNKPLCDECIREEHKYELRDFREEQKEDIKSLPYV